jgi:polyisoprenoid-binding protein YceI
MKGVTKNIVVPVVLKKDIAGTRVAEGTFIVKRLDYGIGLGLWADPETVANDVVVKIRMVLPAPT